MSAATPAPGVDASPEGREPLLSQKQVFIAKLLAIAVLAIAAIGIAIAFRESTSEPTMTVVVKDTRQGMTLTASRATGRSVDGIAFPDWTKQGWQVTGGRDDKLGHDRYASTTLYQRGGRAITLTIVSGTGVVENGKRAGGRTVVLDAAHKVNATYFGFGANVLSDGAMYIFKRTVNGRTVVATGTPISPALYTEMTKLLVTGLDPWNGAVPGRVPTP